MHEYLGLCLYIVRLHSTFGQRIILGLFPLTPGAVLGVSGEAGHRKRSADPGEATHGPPGEPGPHALRSGTKSLGFQYGSMAPALEVLSLNNYLGWNTQTSVEFKCLLRHGQRPRVWCEQAPALLQGVGVASHS